MKMEQTEIELLNIAIAAECGTKTSFAKRIGKSRQAVNDIINNAKKKGGKLKPKFVQELKLMYGIDIYRWKREPTRDFYSANESLPSMAAEDDINYGSLDKKMLEHLRIENMDLRDRLRDCEKNLLTEKKRGRRSA